MALWKSTVTLNQDFFTEVTEHPVPVDMRALKALKQSPLALDIYCWLTYRMSYLRKPTLISWEALRMQFGSNYADTKQGRYEFKRQFLIQLRAVHAVYPDANIEEVNNKHSKGMLLKPSNTHVSRPRPRLPFGN